MLTARDFFYPPTRTLSIWDRVRPNFWYPMASFEQSMMDFDRMADQMLATSFNRDFFHHQGRDEDDDEFFKDLPAKEQDKNKNKNKEQKQEHKQDNKREDKQEDRSFSSYSYSSSSVLDDKGRRITSRRRRYEDSNGRLKALHEREVDGKKLRTIWNRMQKDDEGKHDTICLSGSPEEFEKLWQETPFAKAQTHALKDHAEPAEKKQEQPSQAK